MQGSQGFLKITTESTGQARKWSWVQIPKVPGTQWTRQLHSLCLAAQCLYAPPHPETHSTSGFNRVWCENCTKGRDPHKHSHSRTSATSKKKCKGQSQKVWLLASTNVSTTAANLCASMKRESSSKHGTSPEIKGVQSSVSTKATCESTVDSRVAPKWAPRLTCHRSQQSMCAIRQSNTIIAHHGKRGNNKTHNFIHLLTSWSLYCRYHYCGVFNLFHLSSSLKNILLHLFRCPNCFFLYSSWLVVCVSLSIWYYFLSKNIL